MSYSLKYFKFYERQDLVHSYGILTYEGYSESKYRLRLYLVHPRDYPFAYVQWLPLSIEKPQTPFREIRFMFMFFSVC